MHESTLSVAAAAEEALNALNRSIGEVAAAPATGSPLAPSPSGAQPPVAQPPVVQPPPPAPQQQTPQAAPARSPVAQQQPQFADAPPFAPSIPDIVVGGAPQGSAPGSQAPLEASFREDADALIEQNVEGLLQQEGVDQRCDSPQQDYNDYETASLHSMQIAQAREDSRSPTQQQPPASPTATTVAAASGPVDWQQRCLEAEAKLASLEARNAAMDRLMAQSGQSATVKVRQLTEEMARKNAKIQELERKNKTQIAGLQQQLQQLQQVCDKKERRKSVGGGGGGASSIDAETARELRELQSKLKEVTKEKDHLLRQSMSPSQLNIVSHPSGGAAGASPAQHSPEQQRMLMQARDCIGQLKRSVLEKDCEIESLNKKLADAQGAIITNVEGIADLDSKLQQSRKALRWLLRSNQVSPTSQGRSPSPDNWGASQQPHMPHVPHPQHAAAPPPYAGYQQPRGASATPVYASPPPQQQYRTVSASPQQLLQQHDLLQRSHIGNDQLHALRELEAMLAAREAAQRKPHY